MRTSEARRQEVVLLYGSGISGHDISQRLHMSSNTVFKILRQEGLTAGTGHRNRFKPEQERTIVSLYQSGRSLNSLAEEFGTTAPTLCKLIKRHDVVARKRGGTLIELSDSELDDLYLCWKAGVSQTALANAFHVSQPVMSRWLRQRGILKGDKVAKAERHGNWNGGRTAVHGYIAVRLEPHDPLFCMANNQGYVLEHRLVMARSLGRSLSRAEQVHHKNGNKHDNSPDNLQLRHGAHGSGVCIHCADCGSCNVVAANIE